ncbi:N-acetylneuraminate lyase [Testudinibacter sp. TR-2022]|uniref:N-acetylneuraminate lyase n=1 Tax=Testudinibacter sp. TR-2022 TaxID=2585029 RepID=UPI00111A280C|nr:N-acetylneuraminate lyase [Testudinibacter sp. TR-2022]TNH01989.1 N-acetylneuraminate lyase [Pasteurellaceae bacterium Phil31]TNH04894.1 N-acetylneuraminate lyase [Testudinibacter sp. TR-2022]TNH09941.1 N-acetylneuraminate lyase [Testudinibacter sp. TR-2022]TNH14452.1 N-acetylneuraminate lyase [Testudinibacter sp. TR-2022]TNH17049.1 N-acetylneuraminate lyase [Testudinibacter sp. TR-2022]
MDLSGLYVATLTPFNSDETLNTEDLGKLIEFNCRSDLDGLYVGGSTAEAFLCSTDERIRLLEIAADKATKEKKLIAHIGDISTRKSEMLAKAVTNLRYDAVSAVTPFYYPVGFEQLKNHYTDIIQKCGKPMVVYNFPAFAGVNLSGDQIAQLLNLDGVIALKQTSANLYQMEQITRQNPDKIVYNGFDEILASGLVAGAKGGIGSTYNVQAQRIVELFKAMNSNQVDRTAALQREANIVIDTLIEGGVIPSLKYLLKAKGIIENDTCRRPMNRLTKENQLKLDKLIETALC